MPLFVALLLLSASEAFVPWPCVQNVTRSPAICCPSPPGRTQPCGGGGWGACVRFEVTEDRFRASPLVQNDDRLDWPSRIFSHGCRCSHLRSGFACQRCAFGRTGPRCRSRLILIRRNVKTYSASERRDLRKVLLLGREVPSDFAVLEERFNDRSDPLRDPLFLNASLHYALIFIHRYASRTTLLPNTRHCKRLVNQDMNHKGPAFLTWHRYFMMLWEDQLREAAVMHFGKRFVNFTLPYWDWTNAPHCEVCSKELVGNLSKELSLRDRGPFGRWREFCPKKPAMNGACASCHWNGTKELNSRTLTRDWMIARRSVFPTRREILFALSRPVFFENHELNLKKLTRRWRHGRAKTCRSLFAALEGYCGIKFHRKGIMHNRVHNMAIGPFAFGASSPNDPFFVLHHTQVDRIFERWLRQRRRRPSDLPPVTEVPPGHCGSCNMVGFYPPKRHKDVYKKSRFLGYDYDNFHFGENLIF